MSKRWVIALLSVVVLLAGACEPAEDDEPADLGTEDEPELDETDAQQRLEDAVATTFDEGSAEFTSAIDAPTTGAETGSDAGVGDDGTSAGDDGMSAEDDGTSDDIDDDDGASDDADDDDGVSTDAGDDAADDDGAMSGESDDAGSTGDTDRTAQTEIDGAADWDEDLREMTLSPAGTTQGMGATAILEQSDLYVQLDGAPSPTPTPPPRTRRLTPTPARTARPGTPTRPLTPARLMPSGPTSTCTSSSTPSQRRASCCCTTRRRCWGPCRTRRSTSARAPRLRT